jgi:outer membrane lipase/esterase
VNFIPADVEDLLTYASQHPARFGFTPATVLASSPACTTPASLVCAPAQLVTPNAEQTYLFADKDHLTTAGQTIEADYMYSLLTAPSQISLLAETAVQGGLARIATIRGQIDLSAQHRGPNGVNAWASAGAESLSLKNAPAFPTASGAPFGGSVGADYLTPGGAILGAAVTAGGQTLGFSTGGHFEQANETLSLYAADRIGPLWGNAVASYGLLQNHIARQVTLGTFADQSSADTNGQSPALALQGGDDFRAGPLTTGPVVGLVLQQVRLGGFTETGGSGVTALSFGGQTRDSAVSQLGWRGSLEIGNWQPFADVAWNHEWASKHRSITASLTSTAAPAFSASAAPIAADWASASLGASYRLNPQMAVRGTASAVFGNALATSYGGALSLNVAF